MPPNDSAFLGMGVLPLSAAEIAESLLRKVASASNISCPRSLSSLLRQITRAAITPKATATTSTMIESVVSQFIGVSFRITHQLSGLSTRKSTGRRRYPKARRAFPTLPGAGILHRMRWFSRPPVCVMDWAKPGLVRQVTSLEAAAVELLKWLKSPKRDRAALLVAEAHSGVHPI
jgi:hypothetical protein